MDLAALDSFLRQFRYGVVSSVSSSGTPQSALVGIATTHQFEVIFDTVQSSRKYKNLTESAQCSFVIGWDGEQTAQLEGIALRLEDTAEIDAYKEMYFKVWPDGRERSQWPGIAYFVVKPTWIRYIDYSSSPPAIVEFVEGQLRGTCRPVGS